MRRKMVIKNKTDFDTRAIRSIVMAVAQRHLPKQYTSIHATVSYPRRSHVTGSAIVNRFGVSATIQINIPKDQVSVIEVCHRVKVCFDCVRGAHGGNNNQEFRDWYERPGKPEDYKYSKKLSLPKARVRIQQKFVGASAAMKKAEHAQAKVHHWERKLKYATTMLKKYRKQLKYHAKRGEELHEAEMAKMEQQQGMSVEEFLKLTPVESDQCS